MSHSICTQSGTVGAICLLLLFSYYFLLKITYIFYDYCRWLVYLVFDCIFFFSFVSSMFCFVWGFGQHCGHPGVIRYQDRCRTIMHLGGPGPMFSFLSFFFFFTTKFYSTICARDNTVIQVYLSRSDSFFCLTSS